MYTALGAGGGLLLGAVAGTVIGSDRWDLARPGPHGPAVSVVGVPGGRPGAGLRVAF